ncbi:PrgI family protein [Candidatus Wolfebacteria bacterium]|nr:PrgI family protein [Candidatus Wolfebacteria bacterium]
MQFQIPQYAEVENKLVGPLTIKQFLYLAAAGGISFLSFFIFKGWLWFLITLIVAPIGIALAFIKYNGQPLPIIISYAFIFLWKPRLYIWKKEEEKPVKLPEIPKIKNPEAKRKTLFEMPNVKKLMQDLTTSKKPIAKREKNISPIAGEKMKKGYASLKMATGEKKFAKVVNF